MPTSRCYNKHTSSAKENKLIEAKFMTFGVDAERVSPLEDDIFVQTNVPAKVQKFDHGLFATKWFDYRRMTSAQATFAYVKEYGRVYREIYARDIDYERAKHLKILTTTEITTRLAEGETKVKRQLSGFWRGRQVADALGMPYDVYIEHAITFRMRRWQRAHMPQPQHLYHEFDVEKIQELWEELQEGRLYLPEDPAFMVQNYQNIPYQNDFHEWLFKQANIRGNQPWLLAEFIQKDLLPIDKVASRFERSVYEQITSFLE